MSYAIHSEQFRETQWKMGTKNSVKGQLSAEVTDYPTLEAKLRLSAKISQDKRAQDASIYLDVFMGPKR